MKKIVLPKEEVANPSLWKRLQNAVLYNQRTYTRLKRFCCPPLFYVYLCVWLQVRCHMPLGYQATCCRSLSSVSQAHWKVSAPFFGLPPGSPPADSMCIIAVDNDWGLTPASLVPWSSPARQAECREQYYCKKTQRHNQALGRAGGREGVDFRLFVVLFGIGRFCGGVVLPLLFYFDSGKYWRGGMSCKVHGHPLDRVRKKWWNTDDTAVGVVTCKNL